MRKALIELWITGLRASLGPAKKPVEENQLRVLYDKKDYASMIGHVQNVLRLDMGVRLGLVNKGGPDAPAWVRRPGIMPFYGSAAFRQLVITIYLRKSFLQEANFEETVIAIAHELCHIVLDAIGHPLRAQEEAVDLTAMLLGFRDFYVTGCRSVQEKTSRDDLLAGQLRYQVKSTGYLTMEEVGYAATFMTFH